MLNIDELENQIKEAWQSIVPPALETCLKNMFGIEGEVPNETAKAFADTFDELTTDAIGGLLAAAIDYYVKNIDVTGTVITVGSPGTQTAKISAAPMPSLGGSIPNTFGIS